MPQPHEEHFLEPSVSGGPSLDRREFVLASSTASLVDAAQPTRFRYRQQNAMIWGSYSGDTVSIGRFVGERSGAEIRISFAHTLADSAETVVGNATSRIDVSDDGRVSLIEEFVKDGAAETSVCVECDPRVAGSTEGDRD